MYTQVNIEASWLPILEQEFQAPYMKQLKSFLAKQVKSGKTIYPQRKHIYEAFNHTSFENTKVVIIGQDPYHGPDQAHGLCFSVQPGVRTPPSLKNIYKEINQELGHPIPTHGHLITWAKQGVLLLNQVLTVEKGSAASHQGQGWENFTDNIVNILNDEKENLVFLLWGAPAQKKGQNIDTKKHLVLKSPHPSPLSAYRGFFGNNHFIKTNQYLKKKGIQEIDWSIA